MREEANPLKGHENLIEKVYEDVLSPAAKAVGKTLGSAVRAALRPVDGVVWSLDRAFDWVAARVTALLDSRSIPAATIRPPPIEIEGRVLTALQVVGPGPDPTLRNMFAALLASSMRQEDYGECHPSFPEILRQLTTDEARILCITHMRDVAILRGSAQACWCLVEEVPVRVEGQAPGTPSLHEIFDPLWDTMPLLNPDPGLVWTGIYNLERLRLIEVEHLRSPERLRELHGFPPGNPLLDWRMELDRFQEQQPKCSVPPGSRLELKAIVNVDLARITQWGIRFAMACRTEDFYEDGNFILPSWGA
ncbi:MAG: DUF4393 domain-containing protein [Planctomycetes bacterium]|nr:DUF4393 domain-containing protein [Planctomycetota bacterium]